MRKIAYKFSEIIILLFVIFVWLFSLYKVISYVASLNFRIFGLTFDSEYFWDYPLRPPLPPRPPCPPPCPPPCVTPTPTPTPTTPVEPTSTPTSPPGAPPPSVGGPPGPGGPPHCGAQTPAAPHLWRASVLGGGEVELSWDPVEPTTHYNISYGPSSGNYLYGVSNTGKVTSFVVGGLGTGNYCFALRAVNDCAPSGLSNEICTGKAGQVLGVSTLAYTGKAAEFLYWFLVIISAVCVGLGIRFISPFKKLV